MKTARQIVSLEYRCEGQDRLQRQVYTIEGESGLWQRMPRERRSGLKTPHSDHIVCHDEVNDSLVELRRHSALESLLETHMELGNGDAR
jgi:hypothetical protein